MKKFLALFLALVTVLGLCACGSKGNGGSSGEQMTADGRMVFNIGVPSNAMILDLDDNALTKWMEEQCGVEIHFIEYAGGTDVSTQIASTIAARQELPDILWGVSLGSKVVSRYGQDGYFVDLTDYYEDKEGKAKIFWDRLTNELDQQTQEYILRLMKDPTTDRIYGAPHIETSLLDKMGYQAWINVEWLDKLNMEKPTSTEELYDFLVAVQKNDCNGNGNTEDEIPLFGSQQGGLGAKVIDWLLNMFVYYNRNRPYLVDDNGQCSQVFVLDEYREGLQFINKLFKEGLLNSMAWTASNQEMKTITTPQSGVALCGIFLGHLTPAVTRESPVLYQYEPLQTWGYAIRNDISCALSTFITEDCAESKRDKAFEMIMTMFSWEGSMRSRYGEYGVNWTDATPGAVSPMGLPATYKLIDDPLSKQNTARWTTMGPAFNDYAEGETGELADEMTEWFKHKSMLHAESHRLFAEAEAKNNPKNKMPLLTWTEQEEEYYAEWAGNVGDYYLECQNKFCIGTMDINSDSVWQTYLKTLNDLGIEKAREKTQLAYDRAIEALGK